MRVLVVCQHYWPEPFNVTDICEGLVERGHEVTVLTGLPSVPEGEVSQEYRGGRRRRERRNGVEVVRCPIVGRGRDLHGINKARRVLNYLSFAVSASLRASRLPRDFDVVLMVQYSPVLMALPGIRYARRVGVPSVLYCFDLWPEDMLTGGIGRESVAYRAMRSVSSRIYARASVVAVTSVDFERYFSEELGLEGLRTYHLPQFAEEAFESLDGGSEVDGSEIRLLFAGNVGGNQSVQTIVRAAALLPSDLPVAIDVVGSGSQLDECVALAESLGADKVVFHGRRPLSDMPGLYRRASGTIITLSRPRGDSLVPLYTVPRKLQSYMAAGRPVLAALDGAAASVIAESGCGTVVPSEDHEGLAGSIVAFAGLSAGERREMGRRAREYYDRNFSRRLFFDRITDLLANAGAEV